MSGHPWFPLIGGQESYREEDEKQKEMILSKGRSSLQRKQPNPSVSAAPPVQATAQVLVTTGLVHKTLQCESF